MVEDMPSGEGGMIYDMMLEDVTRVFCLDGI
jgi:hypothetical protein